MSRRKKNKAAKPALEQNASPGFLRLMAAIVYDFFLLVAVFFVATAILLPFNGGEAVSQANIFYRLYLIAISFVFYGWFWTHGGQTLGLRAWKIKVLTQDKQVINWPQALLRFSAAILSWAVFGLGFLWIIVDKKHRSWHDRLSKTGVFFDL